jgi:hypothetical protein
MGEAKKRGTYEQRKTEAEKLLSNDRLVKSQLMQRRPSPKHVAIMGLIAAMTHNVKLTGGLTAESDKTNE